MPRLIWYPTWNIYRYNLIKECIEIEEKQTLEKYNGMPLQTKYTLMLQRRMYLEMASNEQLEKLVEQYKKPEPYKHTIFFLIIYFKALELDPEWLSTMYITTLAMEKEKQIKKDIEELEELKNSHKSKYWTLLEKTLSYLQLK